MRLYQFPEHLQYLPDQNFRFFSKDWADPHMEYAHHFAIQLLEKASLNAESPGKMFGILIVITPEQRPAFLLASSGLLPQQLNPEQWVPSVFDWQNPKGYFRQKEAEISELNAFIESENRKLNSQEPALNLLQLQYQMEAEFAAFNQLTQCRKTWRDALRHQISSENNPVHLKIAQKLISQSQFDKAERKRLKLAWEQKMDDFKTQIDLARSPLIQAQEKRKHLTQHLQNWLFHQFVLQNGQGEQASVAEIFQNLNAGTPPSGTGDCAGPKLLHFAFIHQLKPCMLAEFWWGQTPPDSLRIHGYFYPPCKAKCQPLFTHLLKGIQLDFSENKRIYNNFNINILFESSNYLLISKPSGMLSVPGKIAHTSVLEWFQFIFPEQSIFPVHRLDQDTSGLLLLAKNQETAENLRSQFRTHKVEKVYEAWVNDSVTETEGFIHLPLRPDLYDRPRQTVCFEYGKSAQTFWKLIKTVNKHSLLHVRPITGRTHQIRVHLAHPKGLGTPILGDRLYGIPAERLMLHAAALGFSDPDTGKKVYFEDFLWTQ